MRQLVGLGMIKREKPKAQKGYVFVNNKHHLVLNTAQNRLSIEATKLQIFRYIDIQHKRRCVLLKIYFRISELQKRCVPFL